MMTTEVSGRHAVPVDEPAEPEVAERAKRRVFSAQYKLRILAEYERRDREGRASVHDCDSSRSRSTSARATGTPSSGNASDASTCVSPGLAGNGLGGHVSRRWKRQNSF